MFNFHFGICPGKPYRDRTDDLPIKSSLCYLLSFRTHCGITATTNPAGKLDLNYRPVAAREKQSRMAKAVPFPRGCITTAFYNPSSSAARSYAHKP